MSVLRSDPRFWEMVADHEEHQVRDTLDRLEEELRGSRLLTPTTRAQRAAFRSLRVGKDGR